MASTYLAKTYSGSGNRQRQTISFWMKRYKTGAGQVIFSSYYTSSYYAYVLLGGDDRLQYYNHNNVNVETNRKLRDVNAWYHICITLDTTQATEADRVKIYINGVQETSLNTATYPAQNAEVKFGDNNLHEIGRHDGGSYFDGALSHFHFVTNTAYQASSFGLTDATTGEWSINTAPSVTYNTNSFFILKDGNSVTDQSGQGNNYSVGGGTLSDLEDCPSNVFNTMSNLNKSSSVDVRRNANTTVGTSNSSSGTARSNWNIPTTGKWYFEYKMIPDNQGNTYPNSGIKYNAEKYYNPNHGNSDADIFVYGTYGSVLLYVRNGTNITAGAPASSGDIFGFAIDQDNGAIYVHENGTYMSQGGNVGVPTSGSSKTGAVFTYTAGNYPNMCLVGKEFGNSETQWNFGNGIFFTTPVSSAGSNASGNGIFEYDCPNGYTALSTKGLNL